MRTPEYKMPYDDRLTEEAWRIAHTRKVYEQRGGNWQPWSLNVVSINMADIVEGKPREIDITIPKEEDYRYARDRIDIEIEDRIYRFHRLQRVPLLYVPISPNPLYNNPQNISLCASWNGMRDPLPLDEYFYVAGIPEGELKTVFHFDPDNVPADVRHWGGFFGFLSDGKQKLTDLVGKQIAFVHRREEHRKWGVWNLSSREIFTPTV